MVVTCETTNKPTCLDSEDAQRESNPHFRHGKATGCRYIMGALGVPNCQ